MHRLTAFTAVTAFSLLLAPARLTAQHDTAGTIHPAPAADTSQGDDADIGEGRPGLQYGLASGALSYPGGRTEQSLGVVLRWVPVQWLSLSATPTGSHVHEPVVGTTPATSRSGIVDLPLEASVSHAFAGRYTPTVSAGLGATLPVGDSASGFGQGRIGYSASIGAGFSPSEKVWIHTSAGRSLGNFSTQSALGSGSGWADLSAGTSITEALSVGGGFDTDYGNIDPAIGRSTSLSGNVAFVLHGANTLNVAASHGLSGAAPDWSIAIGIGTAFPYLNHLGAGSAMDNLRNTFGGGSHGLGGGSGSVNSGHGRGRV